jgi:putative phosphoesterase
MLIVIISDVHNNLVNLKKVLDYCGKRKIKKIICCGDLASQETLDFLRDNFSGEILYAFGNMDVGQINIKTLKHENNNSFEYKNVMIFRDFGEVEIEGFSVAFVHYPDKAKKLCESGDYDTVFYGHTHKPWIETIETRRKQYLFNCTMLNPGNVAGEIYLPTFAVWEVESNNFELIKIHDLE